MSGDDDFEQRWNALKVEFGAPADVFYTPLLSPLPLSPKKEGAPPVVVETVYERFVITRELHDTLMAYAAATDMVDANNYKWLVTETSNSEYVRAMVSAQFADAAALENATGKQVIAGMRLTGIDLYRDKYAWIMMPMQELATRHTHSVTPETYRAYMAGVIESTVLADEDPIAELIAAYAVMKTIPSYGKIDVNGSVAREPNVTPDVKLEEGPTFLTALASVPIKLAAAAANVLTGGDIKTELGKAMDAVTAPVEAVVPAVKQETPPAYYRPWQEPSAPSAVQQAANAVAATLTGSSATPAPSLTTSRSDLDRAKSKFYRAYRNQPNGRAADRNRKAKNVVTDVMKYAPKRNDFKGLDDTTGVGAFAPRR